MTEFSGLIDQIYIDYRCYTHDLSGLELISAQERFYKKNPEARAEICQFFNWIEQQRNNGSLPYERIEIREADGRKHGHVVRMMIYDIEYWVQGGDIKKRKIYIADQGQLSKGIEREVKDGKMLAAGDREVGEEG